jgi:hypothetical protein
LALAMEMALAAVAFLAMCVVVLVRSPLLMEPDDYAYRASIIALSQGHLLLTNAQYVALKAQLSAHGGPGIAQWVHLRSGEWISQKNPGYPFFSVVFQWLHALRLAPLFYGAIGCVGLFYGARIWLGRWGGVCAVALYCFSGAALIFAWRPTMPTFTDASLIAGAAGLLLGVLLARDDPPSRRLFLGALAFLALDGATFIRYSDVVVQVVARASNQRRARERTGDVVSPGVNRKADLRRETLASIVVMISRRFPRQGSSSWSSRRPFSWARWWGWPD